jgi:hypothetical protein
MKIKSKFEIYCGIFMSPDRPVKRMAMWRTTGFDPQKRQRSCSLPLQWGSPCCLYNGYYGSLPSNKVAYSKAKLKSSGDKAPPYIRTFWTEKLSDKWFPIWTLLYISFKHILINLTGFMGTLNSMRILYSTYFLTKP